MTRADERLTDLPMTPVRCRRCRATVRVRKSSWEQTSIQWDADGVRACFERSSPARGGLRESDFLTCAALRESIAQAVRAGEVPLAEVGSLPGGGASGAAAEERAVAQ
jgi:hypothetical protein